MKDFTYQELDYSKLSSSNSSSTFSHPKYAGYWDMGSVAALTRFYTEGKPSFWVRFWMSFFFNFEWVKIYN